MQLLDLQGLTPAPAQVCGSFRLVPLLRNEDKKDLRLAIPGAPKGPLSFAPHGLQFSWGSALGGQMATDEGKWRAVPQKTVTRPGKDSIRFLPMNLSLMWLVGLHFAPPRVRWSEISPEVLRHGWRENLDTGVLGVQLPRFEEALRTFEVHPRQAGMIVFVADEFASAFVLPSPSDYRLLHRSLLFDLYGDLLQRYAFLHPELNETSQGLGEVHELSDLRRGLEAMRAGWADFTRQTMLQDWHDRPIRTKAAYQMGNMHLERYLTDLDPKRSNHLGERIVREDGELLYLKNFRLSAANSKRLHLLAQLAAHEWRLKDMAAAQGLEEDELVERFESAGFGALVATYLREQAAKRKRNRF